MATSTRTIAGTNLTAIITADTERVVATTDGKYLGVAAREDGAWWTMDGRSHRTLADAARHLQARAARRAA